MMFHFNVPGFSGGFVGVDIFFVISGFLMTGIILRGLDTPQGLRGFSLLGFYYARARRILPALVVLCAVLMGIGWFTGLPRRRDLAAKRVESSKGWATCLYSYQY